MSDRRLTPTVQSAGWSMTICAPIADLCDQPDGRRDRQLLLGAGIEVFEDNGHWSYVQAKVDGYVGYVRSSQIGPTVFPTHQVGSFATHAYTEPDMKSPDVMALRFGMQVEVRDERKRFYDTNVGFVPKTHLRPLDRPFSDPATIAQLHFGVPYLWGGNSTAGIDCSGLVQAALLACGTPCPADSDLQEAGLTGTAVDQAAQSRGDLIFWHGHVAMVVDDKTLIHANAHHMAVAYEPIATAILRIDAQGGGMPRRLLRL